MRSSLNRFNLDTKTGRVYNALVNEGQVLTAAQITKHFGVKNPTATISDIRRRGYAIHANYRRAGNHVDVTEYTFGRPDRELIALGYKARALGITL
jgi:hypothetical protein